MKVKKLISILESYPADMEVTIEESRHKGTAKKIVGAEPSKISNDAGLILEAEGWPDDWGDDPEDECIVLFGAGGVSINKSRGESFSEFLDKI